MRKSPLFRSLHRPICPRLTGVQFLFMNLSRTFQTTVHRKGPMMKDTSLSIHFFRFTTLYVHKN